MKQGYRRYDNASLQKAYDAVTKKNSTIAAASRDFGVPDQTLRDRVAGRTPLCCVTSGPAALFSRSEEEALAAHIEQMTLFGLKYSRHSVLTIASKYADHLNIQRMDAKRLSTKWFYNFLRRWPRYMSSYGSSQKAMKVKNIQENYYNKLKEIFNLHNLEKNPQNIFIVDTNWIKTDKNPIEIVSGAGRLSERPLLTHFICGNASGRLLPPFFVFHEKKSKLTFSNDVPLNIGTCLSKSCDFDCTVFESFIKHVSTHARPLENDSGVIISADDSNKTLGPVLLLFNSEQIHVPFYIANAAATDSNIHFFILPPNISKNSESENSCIEGYRENVCISFDSLSLHSCPTADERLEEGVVRVICSDLEKSWTPSNLMQLFDTLDIYPLKRATTNYHKKRKRTTQNKNKFSKSKRTKFVPSAVVCNSPDDSRELMSDKDEIQLAINGNEISDDLQNLYSIGQTDEIVIEEPVLEDQVIDILLFDT